MQQTIIFTVLLACAAAAPAPGLLLTHETHLLPLSSKSTLTKSSHAINHGSTYVHTPVVSVLHAPLTSKTTVTKSSQVVNHGGTEVVHTVPVLHATPVVHAPLIHASPVVHAPVVHAESAHVYSSLPAKSSQYFHLDNTVYDHHHHVVPVAHHPVLVHSSPLLTVKSGDSAVSHHSSTVHETVPVVKSLPLYTLHH